MSHLEDSIDLIRKSFVDGSLTKVQFGDMVSVITESAGIVGSNLRRAADLVKAFKAVAVDQSSAEPRLFSLIRYVEDILTSLRPKLKRTMHEISLDIDENIELFCDPGLISQIVSNLVMNSLHHAFTPGQVGHITISAQKVGETLHFIYTDDGSGIEEHILTRLFDPFVTTKRGQGGSGLGTHIIYNLVTQGLGGRIQCFSEAGKGVRFDITLPMTTLPETQ